MKKNIRLLDCTLRDGGHLNQGEFGEMTIKNIIKKLVEANVDIIEIGFLWEKYYGKDTARFTSIEEVKAILPEDKGNSKISVMADFIDLSKLEENDGTIDFIRLSFKRHRIEWALKNAKILRDKGYKFFINPVNCNVYTDQEFLEVIEKVNVVKPYGFSIVDTFGAMRKQDLSRLYYLINHNLNKEICIDLHLHENLGLSYSLAQHFIEMNSNKRDIVIDSSLLGMGRAPGNLCTEQIMDHLNLDYDKNYKIEAVLDAIDEYIVPLKKTLIWGYSVPYLLSAKFNLHRTYAEYLMDKRRLKTSEIQRILSKVSPAKAENFDEEYIEALYREYLDVDVDDSEDISDLRKKIMSYEKVIVIAPGESIKYGQEHIIKEANDSKSCLISVNFIPDFIDVNYLFITNSRRYDRIANRKIEKIMSSNLLNDEKPANYVISYNNITQFNDISSDDSTLMLLNLLKTIGVKEISIAGFDGYTNSEMRFYNNFLPNIKNSETDEYKIKKILDSNFKDINLSFITYSNYNSLDN